MFTKQESDKFWEVIKWIWDKGPDGLSPQAADGFKSKFISSAQKKLTPIEKDKILFRVRADVNAKKTDTPFLIKMTPFSFEETAPLGRSQGRANRPGERHWYLASDMETAVIEARALPKTDITITQYQVKENLMLINLVSIPDEFFPNAENLEGWIWTVIKALYQTPSSDEVKKNIYNTCNYIAGLFKEAGFLGIAWKSFWTEGESLVLFEEQSALHRIKTSTGYFKSLSANINLSMS